MSTAREVLGAVAVAFVAVPLASCAKVTDDDPACDGSISVAVTSETAPVVTSDLVVRGTVSTTRNVAIRAVSVGGIAAKADAFNFAEWSATIPQATLLALSGEDAGSGLVVVVPEVTATPSCGAPGTTTLPLTVDRQARIAVSTLVLQASPPSKGKYFPLNGSALALITVTGNPEARGATVSLTTTEGGSLSPGTLVLAGDGATAATATAQLTPSPDAIDVDPSRELLVGALSKGVAAQPVSVRFAGAPRIFPSSFSLGPGQSLTVSVVKSDPSQTASCRALAGPGVSVTSGGVDLTEAFAPADAINVSADKAITTATTVSVTCRDDYGQTSDASFEVALP